MLECIYIRYLSRMFIITRFRNIYIDSNADIKYLLLDAISC